MTVFVSFEGGDGTGKSTQVEELVRRLKIGGFNVVSIYEPGSTHLGDYLRQWLKKEEVDVPYSTELFLFAAARNTLVNEVIRPALSRPNTVVVADRFIDSTVAYQGYGRGISLQQIEVVNDLAAEGLKPDITFLLDCNPVYGLSRVSPSRHATSSLERTRHSRKRRVDPKGSQRFEKEKIGFHEKVREGYLAVSSKEPERWRVIDATKNVAEISNLVWTYVQDMLDSD